MQIRPQDGSLLHLTSEHAHDAFYEALRDDGYTVMVRHVYHAEEAKKLQDETLGALKKGEIDGVLFYSARTASIFQQLIQRHHVSDALKNVQAVCLSPAVAAACDGALWKAIHAADAPTHEGLMDCLAKTLPVDP
jgi:uroporphyrinogen-III synthase